MGVDETYLGKKQKFLTVVSNLDTAEPLWFGRDRKKETLDEFFTSQLSAGKRMRITAACVDMWKPFRLSIEQWAPNCRIVYDKFHIMRHANRAIDEVRRAEFFRKGTRMRGLVKGKRWLPGRGPRGQAHVHDIDEGVAPSISPTGRGCFAHEVTPLRADQERIVDAQEFPRNGMRRCAAWENWTRTCRASLTSPNSSHRSGAAIRWASRSPTWLSRTSPGSRAPTDFQRNSRRSS